MHDASYWHKYIMARHQTALILGIVLIAMALIFTLSGRCLVKGQGIIYRDEDPGTFWQSIAVYCLLSLCFFGLYLYTLN